MDCILEIVWTQQNKRSVPQLKAQGAKDDCRKLSKRGLSLGRLELELHSQDPRV